MVSGQFIDSEAARRSAIRQVKKEGREIWIFWNADLDYWQKTDEGEPELLQCAIRYSPPMGSMTALVQRGGEYRFEKRGGVGYYNGIHEAEFFGWYK